MMNYDVLVIGGGPGGYTAAAAAAKAGKRVCLVEREKLGGTCLNVGCIPTKYLLDRATALEKIRKMTADGVLRNAGEFSFRRIMKGKGEVIDRLGRGIEGMLRASGVTVLTGSAAFLDAHSVTVGDKTVSAEKIVIATGSSPIVLPFKGSEYCIDSTSALSLTRLPKRISVIGGGVIGLELGSALSAYGARVEIVELTDGILKGEEQSAVSLLRKYLEEQGIGLRLSSRVEAVEKRQGGFVVRTSGGEIETDLVISAVGRRPNTEGLFPERAGVTLGERGEISVNEYLETSVPHIYAIGDVIGGYMLAHAAYAEAEVAVQNILGNRVALDHRIMPRCVYTVTPFAAVGMSTNAAKAAGYDAVVGRFDYRGNGLAAAEGESGCVYAILDRASGVSLGFACVGAGAPEMIASAAIAVERGYTQEDWRRLTVAHPTLSESLREAVLSVQL